MQDHDPVGGNIKDYAVDGVLRRDSRFHSGFRSVEFWHTTVAIGAIELPLMLADSNL